MKKLNVLLLIGLTAFPITAWGVCPSDSCYCSLAGKCIQCRPGYPCNDCANCPKASCCPSKVEDFDGKHNVVYTSSKGFYFVCSSTGEAPQNIRSNVYRCPDKDQSIPDKDQSFSVDTTAIYKIDSGITFKCSEPPSSIKIDSAIVGVTQFYICPAGTEGNSNP